MFDYIMGTMSVREQVKPTKSIHEAFYGKSKRMLEIEKQIGKARVPYLGKKIIYDFYGDPEIEKVGAMLADIFGFEYIDFNLTNDVAPNAYTYCIGRGVLSGFSVNPSDIKKTKEGLKVKGEMKGLSLYIRVTSGLWTNEDLSDGEILAIILHEVGHNFQGARNKCLYNYDFISMLVVWIICVSSGGTGLINYSAYDPVVRAQINKSAKQNPTITAIVNSFSGLSGFLKTISYNAAFILNTVFPFINIGASLYNIIISIKRDPISVITSGIGKSAEYISDDFANELGYGAEISTALTKIQLYKDYTKLTKAISNNQMFMFFNNLSDACMVMASVIMSPIEEHPPIGKRIKAMTDKLEKEINQTDMTSQLKKEAREQVKQMRAIATELENMRGTNSMKKFIKFQIGREKDPLSKLILTVNDTNITEGQVQGLSLNSYFIDESFTDNLFDLM